MKTIEFVTKESKTVPEVGIIDAPIPLDVIEAMAVSGSPVVDNDPPIPP